MNERFEKKKEEVISPYNASGYIDMTPFLAVLSIRRKETLAETAKNKPQKGKNQTP